MTPRIMTVGSCMMDLVSVVDQAPANGGEHKHRRKIGQ